MRNIALALMVGLAAAPACAASSRPAGAGSGSAPAAEQAKQLPGQYTCAFESRGETLGDSRCGIQPEGDLLRLEMSGGTHQLRGTLTATESGFRFTGEYACSDGESCKEPVETEFFEQQKGTYQGVVTLQSGKLLSVTLNKL